MTEIHIITPANRDLYEDVIEKSLRVRYDIFVRELGWNALQRADGRDLDAYDQPDTVYILAIDGERVVGGQRLNPTERPHLLSDVFPHLAHVKGVPVAPDIWEWTRYFVVKERRSGRTDCRLLAAVQEFGLEEGISQLTAVVETWWLPRFHEAGFKVKPLGLPHLVENKWAIAAAIEIKSESLDRVRTLAGIKGSVLVRHGPQQALLGLVRQATRH
jgi:acyl-homoserine lactone synthase